MIRAVFVLVCQQELEAAVDRLLGRLGQLRCLVCAGRVKRRIVLSKGGRRHETSRRRERRDTERVY